MSDAASLAGSLPKPRPQPTPASRRFWNALREERVELQRCDKCGQWVYYPRSRCPACLSDRLTWTSVDGLGRVYTFTVAAQPTAVPFADEVPQLLAIVELTEGVRVSTTLVDVDPGAITIGMPVAPVFDHGDDGLTLLRYRPRA
ncbi:MAG TPA: OB-fold domain-containing protein [Acidimicrobiia bacterium]|nr:OB-fold domain-containing protein [Acidimicrobiia bacterium]